MGAGHWRKGADFYFSLPKVSTRLPPYPRHILRIRLGDERRYTRLNLFLQRRELRRQLFPFLRLRFGQILSLPDILFQIGELLILTAALGAPPWLSCWDYAWAFFAICVELEKRFRLIHRGGSPEKAAQKSGRSTAR